MKPIYYLQSLLTELDKGHLKKFNVNEFEKWVVTIDVDAQLQVTEGIRACVVLDGQQHLVIADDSGKISVLDLRTHQCINSYSDQYGVNVLAAIPGGGFVSGAEDGAIKTWSKKGSRPVTESAGNVRLLIALSNRWIASVSDGVAVENGHVGGSSIQVWDENNNLVSHLDLRDGVRILSLLALEDGKFASGHGDGAIRIWDPQIASSSWFSVSADHHCVATLNGHTGPVTTLALLSDRKLVSTGDNTIRIWDISNGQVSVVMGPVANICFLSVISGDFIVSMSDEIFQIWDLRIGKCAYNQNHNDLSLVSARLNGQFFSIDRVNHHSLKLWSFRNMGLTYEDIAPLIQAMLAKPHVIESLLLDDLALSTRALTQLSKLIRKSESLNELQISDKGLRPQDYKSLKALCNRRGLNPNRLLFMRDMSTDVSLVALPELTTPYLADDWRPDPLPKIVEETIPIPQSFICSITGEIMFNPAIDQDGRSCEKEAIEAQANNSVWAVNKLGYDRIHNFLKDHSQLWQKVYLSPAFCREVESACLSADIESLTSLLLKDPRLVTHEVFGEPQCSLLEYLCRLSNPVFNQLFPMVINLFKYKDWHSLLTMKSISKWLALISMQNNPNYIFNFLDTINHHFNIEIKFIHLALHAIKKDIIVLFRLSFEKLLKDGFEINTDVDGHGNSFLHLAAQAGSVDIVRYLAIDEKLNPSLKNHAKQKPMAIAERADHTKAADAIREAKMAPLLRRVGMLNLPACQIEIERLRRENAQMESELAQLRLN